MKLCRSLFFWKKWGDDKHAVSFVWIVFLVDASLHLFFPSLLDLAVPGTGMDAWNLMLYQTLIQGLAPLEAGNFEKFMISGLFHWSVLPQCGAAPLLLLNFTAVLCAMGRSKLWADLTSMQWITVHQFSHITICGAAFCSMHLLFSSIFAISLHFASAAATLQGFVLMWLFLWPSFEGLLSSIMPRLPRSVCRSPDSWLGSLLCFYGECYALMVGRSVTLGSSQSPLSSGCLLCLTCNY